MNVDIYHISIHISIFISVNIHLSIWTSSIGLCQCAVLAVTPVRLCTSFPYGKNKLFIMILLSIWTLKCHIQPYIHMFMNILYPSIYPYLYLWTSTYQYEHHLLGCANVPCWLSLLSGFAPRFLMEKISFLLWYYYLYEHWSVISNHISICLWTSVYLYEHLWM